MKKASAGFALGMLMLAVLLIMAGCQNGHQPLQSGETPDLEQTTLERAGYQGARLEAPINAFYFLWHLAQSLAGKALPPSLWQVPQDLPALMSAMVMASPPFFILKTPGWQSAHLRPLSAWVLPSNTTLPAPLPSNSTVLPAGTAKAETARTNETTTTSAITKNFFIKVSPPFIVGY